MKPLLMGVLNVTPDSFSDGGLHFSHPIAIESGLRMAKEGADWIDVGGESTRPGSEAVSIDEELRRILPVVEALAGGGLLISCDTRKPEVAERALKAGARMINDISGLRDAAMIDVCGEADCQVVIMHMLGEPQTMQQSPVYGDVVKEVRDYLLAQAEEAESRGVEKKKIWIDPGIGFGKTVDHNLSLLRHLPELVATGYPVVIGASRKSFIGRLLGLPNEPFTADQRLEGTLAAHVLAQAFGASMIRAHDVRAAHRAIEMTAAILG